MDDGEETDPGEEECKEAILIDGQEIPPAVLEVLRGLALTCIRT